MSEERLEGPVEGRAQDVRVILTGLSTRRTAAGLRYPYPDFGSEFIEALHRQLVGPRRRGLIRSSPACPACDRSLEGTPSGVVTVTADVQLRRIPPIRLELEMPGLTCPGCARRLVRIDDRHVQSDLSDALIDAFNRAGIAPG